MDLLVGDRMLGIANVVMRVPPLFIIDELLRIGVGMPEDAIVLNATDYDYNKYASIQNTLVGSIASVASTEPSLIHSFNINCYFFQAYVLTLVRFFACSFGIAASLYIFMLWTGHLIIVYMYLISVGTIFVSYWSNVRTMQSIISYTPTYDMNITLLKSVSDVLPVSLSHLLDGIGSVIIQNYLLQFSLATVFYYINLAPRHVLLDKLLFISFLTPTILGIFPLPPSVLHHAPAIAALLPLLVCKFILWYSSISMIKIIHSGYRHARTFISNYGLSALAEIEWMRLNVPNVLRTFWLLRVLEQVVQLLSTHYTEDSFTLSTLIRTLLVNGCETLTALLGMTSIISSICHYIGCFFRWVLLTEDDEEKSIGTVSAILFYILALQTGLTSLDREKRLVRLFRNFCLLSTAVLHFVHNIVNPVLMSLSASHNPALRRHLRALSVCIFLIIFPIVLLVFLWSHFSLSTWLLAVSIFCIEVIVKVCVSLAIYGLFLFDAYRSTFWEPLDDCLYVIRSFGNTVEFAFGVILFFNGIWILLFESGGAIRAIMMGIHAYFNIWSEAKAGWSVFMKRRTAVYKINSLPEANVEQLRTLDDVCAICYQEMRSAKVTRCNHFFHGVCLRKWLYVQDRCPLCHDILYKVEVQAEKEPLQAPGGSQENNRDQDRDNVENERPDLAPGRESSTIIR
ncbi:hypothetical protein G9C98_001581 [Cotesia typhae]|uniref:RING-type domain-containing protein n=1 Tax=Cotesia typhae TaxID=2053667 RepID=A0A8J5QZ81_9HYME|nr:hypothetical protein G9C98_001581 [Cotesia typhae]